MYTIGLMPIKNEDWILDKSLFALSKICDYVIVADSHSTDNSRNIVKQFSNCILLDEESNHISSNVRLLLLNYARNNFEGNNLLISLDADEIFSSNIDITIIDQWKKLPVGTSISMEWLQLWRSIYLYRYDNSVWTNNWKYFAYIDDRTWDYDTGDGVLDHRGRMPFNNKMIYREDRIAVLHFQFAYFDRMMSKQCHYRMIEKIEGGISAKEINSRYKITKDEKNIRFKKVNSSVYENWENDGLLLDLIMNDFLFWYDLEILKWFLNIGSRFFWDLDIWDINWELKRQIAISHGHKEYENLKIEYPGIVYKVMKNNYRFK